MHIRFRRRQEKTSRRHQKTDNNSQWTNTQIQSNDDTIAKWVLFYLSEIRSVFRLISRKESNNLRNSKLCRWIILIADFSIVLQFPICYIIHIKSTKSTIEQCIVLKKSNYVGQCLIGPLHIAACGKSVDLLNAMVGWISFSRAATRCDLTQLSSTVSSDQWQENNRKKWMGRICINSVQWCQW